MTGVPSFIIKAHFEGQGIVERRVEALSLKAATGVITESGGRVLSVAQQQRWLPAMQGKSSPFDYTRFAHELHALLEAGLSVTRALVSLANFREASGGAEVIRDISTALQKGKSVSQALAVADPPAPQLLVSLVAASEHTGNLGSALARYVAYRERMDGLRKRLVTALLYPGLLTGVGGMVIVFLLGFVVPRFAKTYEGMSGQVPFASRLIIEWGSLLRHHGGLVALVFVALLAFLVFRARQVVQQRGLAGMLAFSSVARNRLRDYELSRFYRTVGIQLAGGIPIVTALESAGVLLRDSDRIGLQGLVERLHQGVAVSAALESAGLASPLILDLVRVGEQSGDLGNVMTRIADFLDESVAHWMESFTRLFEPLLMLGLGIIIAGIVVLLYLPVFDLAENIR